MHKMLKHWPRVDKAVDRYGYWVPFLGSVGAAMTWLFNNLPLISQYGWAAVILAGIAATCIVALVISALLIAVRYFRPIQRELSPFDTSAYSYDFAAGAPSREAYFIVMDFAVQYLWPACERQIELQKAIIMQSEGDDFIKELATEGMPLDPRPAAQPFWIQHNNLVQGIEGSEPTLTFDALVNCIDQLANGAYKSFCDLSEEMARRAKVEDVRAHPTLAPKWEQWRKIHNDLIDEHKKLRQNRRLGRKVYRPTRLARWGEKVLPL
jgi:hypothetical protein